MRTVTLVAIAALTSGCVHVSANSDLDPWKLIAMADAQAHAFLTERGYKCGDMRVYIPANAEGIRHLTFLTCSLPLGTTGDCQVVQLDVTEEKPRAHGVSFRREKCDSR